LNENLDWFFESLINCAFDVKQLRKKVQKNNILNIISKIQNTNLNEA